MLGWLLLATYGLWAYLLWQARRLESEAARSLWTVLVCALVLGSCSLAPFDRRVSDGRTGETLYREYAGFHAFPFLDGPEYDSYGGDYYTSGMRRAPAVRTTTKIVPGVATGVYWLVLAVAVLVAFRRRSELYRRFVEHARRRRLQTPS